MSEIRLWATDLAVLLVASGIMLKILPSGSERNILRFVAVLALIVAVFQLDAGKAVKSIKIEEYGASQKTDSLSEEMYSRLSSAAEDEINKYIAAQVNRFDENAQTECKIGDEDIEVHIVSEKISSEGIEEIKNILSADFECEIKIDMKERGKYD